ncbi:MAG: helicase [Haloplasmataceae bacterium]|nr:helicase [Haloplasmataceae bacterium]
MLEGFIEKARKKDVPIIYLTATPTKKLKKEMASKRLRYFVIPARFHKHPIPYPKVVLTNNTISSLENNKVPKKIMKWLNNKRAIKKQVFIFVPHIKCGLMLESILKKEFNCQFVHAEMSNRKEIINNFRQGNLQFIITTTILERGVTVSNVDVCIIKCDDEIFDERSIVQIIGRAGRNRNHPTADVVLFADYYSAGIKDSLKHIKGMNKIALKEGLIIDE